MERGQQTIPNVKAPNIGQTKPQGVPDGARIGKQQTHPGVNGAEKATADRGSQAKEGFTVEA